MQYQLDAICLLTEHFFFLLLLFSEQLIIPPFQFHSCHISISVKLLLNFIFSILVLIFDKKGMILLLIAWVYFFHYCFSYYPQLIWIILILDYRGWKELLAAALF